MGIDFAQLDAQAYAVTDNEASRQPNEVRDELLREVAAGGRGYGPRPRPFKLITGQDLLRGTGAVGNSLARTPSKHIPCDPSAKAG